MADVTNKLKYTNLNPHNLLSPINMTSTPFHHFVAVVNNMRILKR